MNNGNGHDLSIEDVDDLDVDVEHPGSRTPTNDAPIVGNGNGEDDEGHGEEEGVEAGDVIEVPVVRQVEHEEEEDVIAFNNSEVDNSFDSIIGCIEDIVIGEEFQDIQEALLENNYEHFDENVEENKLIYTDIYQEYTKTVEDFIEEQLKKRIENFCMKDFLKELELRKTELEGEVFEMLFTLTDFLAFKEMFVDYKVMKQSGALDNILSITSSTM